ncbi:MAG: nucleotidyltransferase family protein, partial [Legionellales bacterium]
MKVAMIFAAGRGERLKPLTDSLPKALCSVHGRALIEHHVTNLAQAGYTRIVINHAYLGGKIKQHLGDGNRFGVEICYSPEPPGALETGGAVVRALPLLGEEPFITVNADIYTNFDFANLPNETLDNMHLILVDKNPALKHHGDFGLMPNHLISNSNREYTFSGIACYHPRVFKDLPQGRYSL